MEENCQPLPDRRQPILLWAIRRFLTAFSNRVLMFPFTVSTSKPVEKCYFRCHTRSWLRKYYACLTWWQLFHSIIDGMSRLLCAAVKLFKLNRLDLTSRLQIKNLNVPRKKGHNAGRSVHWMGNVYKACVQNNRLLNNTHHMNRKKGFQTIPLPLASEQTARNPSSVRNRNNGRTPYVSLPRWTFLLAVSSKTNANTPSRREAIFLMPKRSYIWSKTSPSTLVW